MTEFSKILTHPEKDNIITQLVSGKTPKEVNDYLKDKYTAPEQKHLVLSQNILKEFTDKHINLYAQLEKDIQAQHGDKLHTKTPPSVKNNKLYQERLAELVGKEIDIINSLEKIVHMLEQRLEQVFDATQLEPENTKNDFVLIKLHDSLMVALEKYDKIKNNRPDQVIQHNVTIQTIENHTLIFQEAIRETLMEFDPETASKFLDSFTTKLNQLEAPKEKKIIDIDKRLAEVSSFSERIETKFED